MGSEDCHKPAPFAEFVVTAAQFKRLVEASKTHGWPAWACAESVSELPPEI